MLAPAEISLSERDFKVIQDVVYKHSGISLNNDKQALVRARLAKLVRGGGFETTTDYLNHVLSDLGKSAFIEFIDAISTNLTSFFREGDHFKYLSDTVLPAMLPERRIKGDSRVLAWSAACSSGEEPYSLAMTLLDAIGRQPRGPMRWDPRVLATDISTRMLAAARAGVYGEARVKTVPANYRAQFLTAAPAAHGEPHYEVSPDVRQVIRFRHLNLMDTWPFSGPFDFIFCRNVMIYFDQVTQQRLVQRFWNCLKPGGLLFTGHSESLTSLTHRFTSVKASIYAKPK